ncbi:uncharacterized protein [Ptychodera flava]|uniref:uncharacterized protein isoform X2 n=1 Tax=Ptychodera flava TaxID=63121 RepID=UPI00396A6988
MPSFKKGRNLQAPSRRPKSLLSTAIEIGGQPSTSSEGSYESGSLSKESNLSIGEILQGLEINVRRVRDGSQESTNTVITNINSAFKKYGLQLEKENKGKVDRLFTTFRTMAMDTKLNFISRLQLLELIELRAAQWSVKSTYYGRKYAKLEKPFDVGSGDANLPAIEKTLTRFSESKSCQNVQNWLKNIQSQSNSSQSFVRGSNLSHQAPSEVWTFGSDRKNTTETKSATTPDPETDTDFCHGVSEEDFLERYSRHEELVQETLAVNLSQAKSVFGPKGKAVIDIMEISNAYIKFLPTVGTMRSIHLKGNRLAVNKAKELIAQKRKSVKSVQEPYSCKTQVGLTFSLPQKEFILQNELSSQRDTSVVRPSSYHSNQHQQNKETLKSVIQTLNTITVTIPQDRKADFEAIKSRLNYKYNCQMELVGNTVNVTYPDKISTKDLTEDVKAGFYQLKEVSKPYLFEIPISVWANTTIDNLKNIVIYISKKSGCVMQILFTLTSTVNTAPDGYIAIADSGTDQADYIRAKAFLSQAFYKISNPSDNSPPTFGESADIYQDMENLLKDVQPQTEADGVAMETTIRKEEDELSDSESDRSSHLKEKAESSTNRAEILGDIVVPSEEDWSTGIDEYAKPHKWKRATSLVDSHGNLEKTTSEKGFYLGPCLQRKRKKQFPCEGKEGYSSTKAPEEVKTSSVMHSSSRTYNTSTENVMEQSNTAESRVNAQPRVNTQPRVNAQPSPPLAKDLHKVQHFPLPPKFGNEFQFNFSMDCYSNIRPFEPRKQAPHSQTLPPPGYRPFQPMQERKTFPSIHSKEFNPGKWWAIPEKSGVFSTSLNTNTGSWRTRHPEMVSMKVNVSSNVKTCDIETKTQTTQGMSQKRIPLKQPIQNRRSVTVTRQPFGPDIQNSIFASINRCTMDPLDKSALSRRRQFSITKVKKDEFIPAEHADDDDNLLSHQPFLRKDSRTTYRYSRDDLLEIGKTAAYGEIPPFVDDVDDAVRSLLLVPEGWFDPVKFTENLR